MSMTTPISCKVPVILDPMLKLRRNFSVLQVTQGTVLRISADVSSAWIALLLVWLVMRNTDSAALISGNLAGIVLLVSSYSLLIFVAYTAVGLYARTSDRLRWKAYRIASINFMVLAIAITGLSCFGQPHVITAGLLSTTIIGLMVTHFLARVVSVVLRLEDRRETASGSQNTVDERHVLVIGGAGYIGSALVERLLELGLQVSVLDAMLFGDETLARVGGHPRLMLIREDFRHIEALTRAINGVGAVIHLGGLVGDPACAVDTEVTVDVNVTATKVIGEIAKARGVRRFIFASSCSVYGASDEIVNEDTRFNPQSLYARTKVASEAILETLNDANFTVTCLRFATIYGISGRARFDLVVNLLCAKAVRDRLITVYGPDQWRPFVHVDDVASSP
jgi:dTDP-4-dehydrorhamnose reductase